LSGFLDINLKKTWERTAKNVQAWTLAGLYMRAGFVEKAEPYMLRAGENRKRAQWTGRFRWCCAVGSFAVCTICGTSPKNQHLVAPVSAIAEKKTCERHPISKLLANEAKCCEAGTKTIGWELENSARSETLL